MRWAQTIRTHLACSAQAVYEDVVICAISDTCATCHLVIQGWCGPSKAINATFKRIFYDNSDNPLKFYTVRCFGMC